MTQRKFERLGHIWLTVVTLALLLALSGCGASATTRVSTSSARNCRGATEVAPNPPTPPTGVRYVDVTADGRLRDYRLFVPPALDKTTPIALVITLHGSPSDAAGFEDYIHFDNEAAQAGFLEASPNGCDGYWDDAEGRSKLADEDFLKKMIQQLETQFAVDQSRVYVAGWSGGGWMAYRMACDLAGSIRAIASISGAMRLSDGCEPARPVSILEMHGSMDEELPWQGGGPHGASPVDEVIQRWTNLDGCTGHPLVTQSIATVTSISNNCQSKAQVRLDKIVGGDHGWFLSPAPGQPDVNAAIWSFFSTIGREDSTSSTS